MSAMNESAFIQKSASLTEGEGSKGCLMFPLSPEEAFPIREWVVSHVPAEALAGSGREAEIHVTVAYGFDAEVSEAEVIEACRNFGNTVDIKLGTISRFDTNPEYDVIKVNIDSLDLFKLNDALRKHFGDRLTTDYPDYHPHLTLAYVKKGAVPKLDNNSKFDGNIYRGRQLTYSYPNAERKVVFSLSSKE